MVRENVSLCDIEFVENQRLGSILAIMPGWPAYSRFIRWVPPPPSREYIDTSYLTARFRTDPLRNMATFDPKLSATPAEKPDPGADRQW